MLKTRRADYCNLKLLLIFLVVYGHWIEPQIETSREAYLQYQIIYFVHIPLFAFLSGLFLRGCEDCRKQIKHLLPVFLILQTAAVIIGGTPPLRPWWHLWYIPSCCTWTAAVWLWFRYGKNKLKFLMFSASLITCLTAGCIPFIGRTLSASRTLVFFPFFWMGVICDYKIQWQKMRIWGLVSLEVSAALMIVLHKSVSADFLYGATPYENIRTDMPLRLLCCLAGITAGFFLLTWMPDRRMIFTKAGADTMPVYLIHAPIVMLIRKGNMHWCLCAVFSAILIYAIFKAAQWNSPLCRIVQSKGSEKNCRIFREYTKNTQKQSTDFFFP